MCGRMRATAHRPGPLRSAGEGEDRAAPRRNAPTARRDLPGGPRRRPSCRALPSSPPRGRGEGRGEAGMGCLASRARFRTAGGKFRLPRAGQVCSCSVHVRRLPRPGPDLRRHPRRAVPRHRGGGGEERARGAPADPALAAPQSSRPPPHRAGRPGRGRDGAPPPGIAAPGHRTAPPALSPPAAPLRLAAAAGSGGGGVRVAVAAPAGDGGDGGPARRRPAGGPPPAPALPDAGGAPHRR